MTARLSLLIATAVSAVSITGCQLGNSPPWAKTHPTAKNPYGTLAARQAGPSQDPFLRNGAHYTAHPNMYAGGVGRVTIPSAGHPVPNGIYGNTNGAVMQAGYQANAGGANPFEPQPAGSFTPPANHWQPSQPRTYSQQMPAVQPH